MAAPYTTAVSNQPYRNSGGTILKGGSGNTEFDSISELSNAAGTKTYGTQPFLAVSPTASGNVGTRLAKSGGTFAKPMTEGQFVALVMGTHINGSATNLLKIPAADYSQRKDVNAWQGYERLHITAWNAVTGAATKGGSNGVKVNPSGIDGVVGVNADNAVAITDAVPGELTYLTTTLPTNDEYSSRTNP
jgi:hypothetical protein